MRSDAVGPQRVPIIVIPCLNEAQHIEGLAQQMVAEVAPFGGRVIIADGGSDDGTVEIAAELERQHPSITLMHNAARLQSSGINEAVAAYGGGFTDLIRIDAHGAYPDGYISTLLEEAEATGAASIVVGMVASGDHLLQRINAATQNSKLGNGGSKHRQRGSGQFVEHGHHALMRMDAFQSVGGYDPTFSHNEDAELDHRLVEAGHRIWLTNRTEVTYFPRRDLSSLARQYYNYGRGRARNQLKHGTWPKLRQAIVILIAPLVALAALAPLHWLFILPVLVWSAAACMAGVKLAFSNRSLALLLAGPIAMLMHFAWSTGFWTMVARSGMTSRKAVAG
ncbi:glycosyltransferase family 2 protein [Gymnodinialimonas sp. 2305UL16-5]|uniref:glycosyltransferase family 2 protein n=1 Tax=Gymnodinialimonas mytili TaxID=3126503 RepID=UPI0030A573AE